MLTLRRCAAALALTAALLPALSNATAVNDPATTPLQPKSSTESIEIGKGSYAVPSSSVSLGKDALFQHPSTESIEIGKGSYAVASNSVSLGEGGSVRPPAVNHQIATTIAVSSSVTVPAQPQQSTGAPGITGPVTATTATPQMSRPANDASTSSSSCPSPYVCVESTGGVPGAQASPANAPTGAFGIVIGSNSSESGAQGISIGAGSNSSGAVSIAEGAGANATGDDSVALGALSNAAGFNSTAVGTQANAAGNNSTALGAGSDASGDNATALGAHSNAGVDGTAVGSNSAAADQGTALGANSNAAASGSTAVGNGASVDQSAKASTALGQGAHVGSNASNSVALGNGSYADRPNTVSVGDDGADGNEINRQVTNVADGTMPTDATNLRQLQTGLAQTLQQANYYTDQRFGVLNTRINQAGAAASALGLVAATAAGNPSGNRLAMGFANYNGQSGAALAYQHIFATRHPINFTLGASFSGGQRAVGGAVSIGF